jgi:hypothetical protein
MGIGSWRRQPRAERALTAVRELASVIRPRFFARRRSAASETCHRPPEVEHGRPVGIAGQFIADDAVGHEESRGEGVGLALHLLQSPDVLAVHDEMTEFVGAVETGSGPVVLIGGENHEPVVEGQREGVDVGGVQRHPLPRAS